MTKIKWTKADKSDYQAKVGGKLLRVRKTGGFILKRGGWGATIDGETVESLGKTDFRTMQDAKDAAENAALIPEPKHLISRQVTRAEERRMHKVFTRPGPHNGTKFTWQGAVS